MISQERSVNVIKDLIIQRRWRQSDFDAAVLALMVANRRACLASIGFEAKAAHLQRGAVTGVGTSTGTGVSTAPCTPEQVLTVASIAESEVVEPADGARVAEALYRRLAAGDYLAVDSTALYAIENRAGGAAGVKQITDPRNPYSTYAHHGLPPTPITVPPDPMITAALNPTDGGVYYRCVTDSGTEFFKKSQESTLEEACLTRTPTP